MDVKVTKSLLMTALITGSVMFGSGAAFAAESVGEFDLDQIVVTATRTEKRDLDVPAMVEVFDEEKISKWVLPVRHRGAGSNGHKARFQGGVERTVPCRLLVFCCHRLVGILVCIKHRHLVYHHQEWS